MATIPPLLTPREVSALCGVSRTTVARWARAGKIRYTRTPGNRIRIFTNQPFIISLLVNRGIIASRQEPFGRGDDLGTGSR